MNEQGGAGAASLSQGPRTSPLLAPAPPEAQGPPGLDEVLRVCRLTTERRLTPEEVEAVNYMEVPTEALTSGFRLWRQQAEAIIQYDMQPFPGGGFFPLRVGGGKTNIGFLCLKHGHSRGVRKSLLIVPARGVRKLVDLDVKKARQLLGLEVPVYVLPGLDPASRRQLATSNRQGIYVTTYSLLSQKTASEELAAIDPDLVVADEAHLLANARTAAAMKKRLFRCLQRLSPPVGFVALSGTMSRKSFLDAWPLLVYSLKDRAPVPHTKGQAEFWAAVLDPSPSRPPEDFLQLLEPLRHWAIGQIGAGKVDPAEVTGPILPEPEGYRRAFRIRRSTAPGVVSATEGELGCSLVIENRPAFAEGQTKEAFAAEVDRIERGLDLTQPAPLPDDFVPAVAFQHLPSFERLVSLAWAIRTRWRTPSGDEIEYALHTWQGQFELTSGFYSELLWPEPTLLASDRGITAKEAEKILAKARHHRASMRAFVREMRGFLLRDEHVVGLDTPLLVWAGCEKGDHNLPRDLRDAWRGVRAAEFDDMPERESHTVRVSDWKIQAAVRWAKEQGDEGGLVWVWNKEIAAWTYEIFKKEFGEERVLWCPAGSSAADKRIQDTQAGDKFAVASIDAHGKIKDLFHWKSQVFVQFPRNAGIVEQTLGRTHRYGQQADEVKARTLNTLEWDHQNYCAMLYDAMWLSQVEAKQKVIHADYDPLPKTFPPKFLQERGFQLSNVALDKDVEKTFGQEKRDS